MPPPTLQLQVLTGARAGFCFSSSGTGDILIGRHPDSVLQFDPERDLQVSTFHAILTWQGEHWLLQDLRSRNGTFLNGVALSGATPLRTGDRIEFGRGGPEVDVSVQPDPAPGPAPLQPAGAAFSALPGADAGTGKSSTGERVRVEVLRQTRRLRLIAAASVTVLLVVAGTFLFAVRSQREGRETERARLQERIDSLLVAGEVTEQSLSGQLAGLGEALKESQDELRELRDEVERAASRGDAARVPVLRRRLEAAETTMMRQQRAAALDFRDIEAANGSAVAVVYVESQGGEVTTATAFAVRPDATLLTARHAIVGPDGTARPRRLAVQFSNSDQVWPARLLRVSSEADLAVIKVDNILGGTPTIRGFGASTDTLRQGAPVAVIGFPRGGQSGISEGRLIRMVRPVISSAVVESVASEHIELTGYGAVGASGSPIFDAEGRVVAILYGGREEGGSHMIVAVPVGLAVRLLESLPR